MARLLKDQGFSLQSNVKTLEGAQHPDRDAQFRYISTQAEEFLAAGDPVISVDAKKKEKVGQFKQAGRTWRPKGQPEKTNVHDFLDKDKGKVTPYGIYDIGANSGWVASAPTTTPPSSPSTRSARGGTRPAMRPARARPGC